MPAMPEPDVDPNDARRRWGDERAPRDDEEARQLLLAAAGRCMVRRGGVQIRMAEVADEAGVARSTLYRYFPTRADLVLGLLLSRLDGALVTVVRSLDHPDDAARSLPDLVLGPLAFVDGNPLNEALYSPGSSSFVSAVEMSSEAIIETTMVHYGPLLERWQSEGQLRADLDLREMVRWIQAIALYLLGPPWRPLSRAKKRTFVDQYFVRAVASSPSET